MRCSIASALLVLAGLVAMPSLAEAGYRGGAMNLYEYARVSPSNYVDWNGAQPKRITTRPAMPMRGKPHPPGKEGHTSRLPTSKPSRDWWGNTAKAVDEGDWVAAARRMAKAWRTRKEVGPTGGKACCCKGPDRSKCHVVVTHVAKLDAFLEAGKRYKAKDIGWPFAGDDFKPRTFWFKSRVAMLGVITRVQVKHDDGKDTRGCWLKGDAYEYMLTRTGVLIPHSHLDDFEPKPYWSRNALSTANASNWYIDSPITASPPLRVRYWSMRVSVVDEKKKPIRGLTANYGWAFKAEIDNSNWRNSKVSWRIWPSPVGKPHVDPKWSPDPQYINQLRREWGP